MRDSTPRLSWESALTGTSSVRRDGTVSGTVTVTNTGGRAGTQVVPIYVHQPVSDVVVAGSVGGCG